MQLSILSCYELRVEFDNLKLPNEERRMLEILLSS